MSELESMCAACQKEPCKCLFPDPPPGARQVKFGADETIREQAARIQELESTVENLRATQMEEIVRIGLARDSEKEEAAAEIDRLEQQIRELEDEPWPQWCTTILNKMIEFGAWDPRADGPEVDLGEVFTEWLAGLEEAEQQEDIALQSFRVNLLGDVNDIATQASKINQWAVERQKRPNSDYVEVATRMLELNRKVRADIRREETRRQAYYRNVSE